jgi:hypothetical protein
MDPTTAMNFLPVFAFTTFALSLICFFMYCHTETILEEKKDLKRTISEYDALNKTLMNALEDTLTGTHDEVEQTNIRDILKKANEDHERVTRHDIKNPSTFVLPEN